MRDSSLLAICGELFLFWHQYFASDCDYAGSILTTCRVGLAKCQRVMPYFGSATHHVKIQLLRSSSWVDEWPNHADVLTKARHVAGQLCEQTWKLSKSVAIYHKTDNSNVLGYITAENALATKYS